MSNIDVTKPIQGHPTTQSVRDNFSTIKTELENFQDTSSVSLGDALVGVKSTKSNSVASTQHEVNERRRSVFDFMTAAQIADVVGYTYAVDVTTALQTAITSVIGSGGRLEWPDGGYKITDELTIPFSTGWKILGASRLGTILKQYTDNKRIFKFTADLTHSWTISGFSFDYNAQQAVTNTTAIPIHFVGTGSSDSFFNFEISDCVFNNCYYGISGNSANSITVWGGYFKRLSFSSGITGGSIRLTQTGSSGQPNNNFDQIFIDAANSTLDLLTFNACENTQIGNVEILSATNVNLLKMTGGCTADIGEFKVEGGSWTTANTSITDLSNAVVSFGRLALLGTVTINPGAGNYVRFLSNVTGGTSSVHVDKLSIGSGITVSSGNLYLANFGSSEFCKIEYIDGSLPSGAFLTDWSGTASAEAVRVEWWNDLHVGGDSGDAATTVTAGSTRKVIRYNTTLTADRDVSLPNAGNPGNQFTGLSYIVIREALGNFRLRVMNGGNVIFAFPPNTTGVVEVVARRSTWHVIRKFLRPSVNTTAVGNVGGGEDNLITFSLPVIMARVGDSIRITVWGTAANNANAKTLKLYFGTTAIINQALTANQAGRWRITADVCRTGASAQDYSAQLIQGGTTTLLDAVNGSLTETDTGTITIKCTGTGTNDNDIVQEGFIAEFFL